MEQKRLQDSLERKADWKYWGTYVSDRQWATVREDYSSDNQTWSYFPHDHARSRAYRWSEDALGGFCNRFQNVCLGLAFWNENDPIIKERLFGLGGNEGNHGEDCKEHYFYVDNTPTHSYSKMLYKYPMNEYPYSKLVSVNGQRSKQESEYELEDTGIFDNNEYFDCFIEYAKADQEDILCRVTVHNRSTDKEAPIHVLPHLWFRNTWSWGYTDRRPYIHKHTHNQLVSEEVHIGKRYYIVQTDESEQHADTNSKEINYLFTENDTNTQKLFNWPNASPYVKDGINNAVVNKWMDCVNHSSGTKVAAHCKKTLKPGESFTVKIRFANYEFDENEAFADFDQVFKDRIREADEFYENIVYKNNDCGIDFMDKDLKLIQRQSLAGLLWTKQYYHFGVNMWKNGDPAHPRAHPVHRNNHWDHFYANDVISMPDKWEFPFLASWDLAFQMIPMMLVDIEWTKRQLILVTREWYTHSSGQFPAYEFDFGDVNPPVHAWATLEVYNHILKTTGVKDLEFLEQIFHKCLLNFTWWVNKKDIKGNNIFEGGFLGLDNIGVFDRSSSLPNGAKLQQADGTSWMAFYSANMLKIALILAKERRAYESIATKFLEHFINIAKSINSRNGLWNNDDGFYFDSIVSPGQTESHQIKVYSFVGLIPLFAAEILDYETLQALPKFKERLDWFVRYRPNLVKNIAPFTSPGQNKSRLLSIVNREKLEMILKKMLDENWFLSENGIRSLSKHHLHEPYRMEGTDACVTYLPAESDSGMFGGNSNWRGTIWLAVNYLMIQSLRTYYQYYGDELQIEYPTGSENFVNLEFIADDISKRLIGIFRENKETGSRKFSQVKPIFKNEHWKDYLLFNEYFHGDTAQGLGASHQTGWTALVGKLISEIKFNKSN
ncbi:hypothetical protein DICPUDRAFT_49280 [Dictyostelium purpureum]|uniref:Glycosyl hydrolase family 63 C-terminal domain-containing protein n=1 Tax=Dictyostelium purpureum TaxID=5786 RepID=F0ZT51_DICPU|nr:uncharacterized protein DICPUDRAFT_49280 [Dictyostelium purpureum]EGC32873.1 hypothetical protein DICPUDRAFT_49280 [Dictyostelium purpureum]|eukprot:XP_003290592.1 hypothetical protein DICPUDRAFT_49280 [Dictyostelium purpureum]